MTNLFLLLSFTLLFAHKTCRPNPQVKPGCELDFYACDDKAKDKCTQHQYVMRRLSCQGQSPCYLKTQGIESGPQTRRAPAPAPRQVAPAPKPKPRPAPAPKPQGPGMFERAKDAFLNAAAGNDGSAKRKTVQWAGGRTGDSGGGKCWCITWRQGMCGSGAMDSASFWPCGRPLNYDPKMENVFVTRSQLQSCCAKANRNYRAPVEDDAPRGKRDPVKLPAVLQRIWTPFLENARCVTVAQREAMIAHYLDSNGCVGEHKNDIPCLEAASTIRQSAPRLCAGEREPNRYERVSSSLLQDISQKQLIYFACSLVIIFGAFVYSRRKTREDGLHELLVVDINEL